MKVERLVVQVEADKSDVLGAFVDENYASVKLGHAVTDSSMRFDDMAQAAVLRMVIETTDVPALYSAVYNGFRDNLRSVTFYAGKCVEVSQNVRRFYGKEVSDDRPLSGVVYAAFTVARDGGRNLRAALKASNESHKEFFSELLGVRLDSAIVRDVHEDPNEVPVAIMSWLTPEERNTLATSLGAVFGLHPSIITSTNPDMVIPPKPREFTLVFNTPVNTDRHTDEDSKVSKSLGERLVGINFNPSAKSEVDAAKLKSAELIDLVHVNMLGATTEEAQMIHNEALRRIMDAQMWAVKALTWKD